MPTRAKKPCGKPGCSALVAPPTKMCEQHAHLEPRKRYDRERATAPHRAMYKTARWQHLRKMKLTTNPWCESGVICDPEPQTGRRAQATDVHHKLGVQEWPDLQWDFDNLEALCHACHSHITALTEGFARPTAA